MCTNKRRPRGSALVPGPAIHELETLPEPQSRNSSAGRTAAALGRSSRPLAAKRSPLRTAMALKPPRSLCVLLQALVSSRVTIETRSGLVVSGVLASVDSRMNLTLSDASTPSASFASLYIAGAQIVFAHLPEDTDVAAAVDAHVAKARARGRR